MAFSSRITYISASAATLTYAFSFDYIDASYVKVYFDGVLQSGVTVTTGQVTLTTGADPGVEVLIQRETPTTRLVDFVDGAVLTENDLDLIAKQALHVSIEAKDDSVDGLQLNAAGDAYDANNKKIENLAAPTATNDAARKSETDALDTRVTAAEGSITTLEGVDAGHAMVTNGSNRWDAESRLIKNVADGVDAQDAVSKNQLGTLSVSRGNISTDFTAQSKRILNLATPINDTDAATKKYVDDNAGGGGGSSTLQDAYDNSTSPEILTDATNGALSVKRGSAADTDNVVEVLNNAGTVTAAIAGDGTITTSSTVDGRDIATDGTKLDGIETGATADQTGAEIKTAYEAEADTNAFTDAEKTLLGNQSGTNTGDEAAATDTTAGVVELATQAEVDTGTDTARAVTPASLATIQADVDANSAKVSNVLHTGDVTGATSLTIASNAVTFAKMQNLSANVLIGRTGTTGDPEEISCTSAGRALLDDADAAAQRTTLALDNLPARADHKITAGPAGYNTAYLVAAIYATVNIEIVEVKMTSTKATTGSSAGNYWTFIPRRSTDSANLASAPYDTYTDGEISSMTTTDLKVDQNQSITAGNRLDIVVQSSGSPTSLNGHEVVFMITYKIA